MDAHPAWAVASDLEDVPALEAAPALGAALALGAAPALEAALALEAAHPAWEAGHAFVVVPALVGRVVVDLVAGPPPWSKTRPI